MFHRKTMLVSVYYNGTEPRIWEENKDGDVKFCLDCDIKTALRKRNPNSDVFDVAIDECKPSIFSMDSRIASWVFSLLRVKTN